MSESSFDWEIRGNQPENLSNIGVYAANDYTMGFANFRMTFPNNW